MYLRGMKKTWHSIPTYMAALILFVFGMIYLLRGSFMPYHSEAVGMSWEQVQPSMQYLLLALMRAAAGGFLATATAIMVLQFIYQKTR
jgi:hypothetical protein